MNMRSFNKQCKQDTPELDCVNFERCVENYQRVGKALRICESEPAVLSYITEEDMGKLIVDRGEDYE